ncbi:hypothetical protein EDB84DRAFT_1436316 [Lactarius hengduanensis]|nr:hypothetical protein EDB84DRAFT_1436316 [Lactarius hengduanensis]
MTKAVNMKAGEEEVIARLSIGDGNYRISTAAVNAAAWSQISWCNRLAEITASSSGTGSMSIPMLVAHAGITGLFDRVMQQMTGRCLCLSQRDLRLERDTARQGAVTALRQSEVGMDGRRSSCTRTQDQAADFDTRECVWSAAHGEAHWIFQVVVSYDEHSGTFRGGDRKDPPSSRSLSYSVRIVQWLFLREPEPDIMGKGDDLSCHRSAAPSTAGTVGVHTDEEVWVEGQVRWILAGLLRTNLNERNGTLCRFPMASESPNHQANHLTVVPFVPASIPNKYWYMAYSLRQRFFNGVIYVPVAVQNPMRCP